MTEERQFFETLLVKTRAAYDILKNEPSSGVVGYAICATPILLGRGILMGINWGGSKEGAIEDYPGEGVFKDDKISDYPFAKRSKDLFQKYLPLDFDRQDFNYTNLCLFRTPDIKKLPYEAYEKSVPLFKQFVEFVKPPWIFAMGTTVVNRLIELEQLKREELTYYPGQQQYYGASGLLWGHPFYCVPHPNARVGTELRQKIWSKVCANLRASAWENAKYL